MVKVENMNKSFGSRIIIKDFNYIFYNGKMYGIKGKSGSGKSTLLNILGMIDSEYTGRITIGNVTVDNKKIRRRILKEKIFYLFQNYALVDDMTVDQNFKLILNINPEFEDEKEKSLERVGLSGAYLNRPIYSLSGGEQQRVSLARAYLRKFEIILADEPTGNLDTMNAEIICNLLNQMKMQNKIVIIASHDEKVLSRCDEIIELDNLYSKENNYMV